MSLPKRQSRAWKVAELSKSSAEPAEMAVSWVEEEGTAFELAKKAVSGGESGRTEQRLS
ncbi:hypothetical protein [Paenibacillus ferrarius]|uniref:hypothetical protein n=1 Tax=Paenibacillus ferrarius TaxID=1469647 RepID=UPI001301D4E3|nr:hypothetical protein [Paenibacillus ferrarius]